MKLEAVRKTYYDYSGKLSEITRKLDFAGIAVVWVFRVGEKSGGIAFATCLLWSLGLFVLSLACDLLQYAYASCAWGIFHRVKERTDTREEEEFMAPSAINWPTLLFFWTKVVLAAVGYGILTIYIAKALCR